jgi:hypothetical protein
MVGDLGIDGAHPADIVGHFTQMRPKLADVHSALPVLLELERRLHQFAGSALGFDVSAGKRLAVILLERGLRIEAIDGGASSVHEQEDHAFDALRIVQFSGENAAIRSGHVRPQ